MASNTLALYRKYRPVGLADVVGQDHITTTLANQIASGRLSHAYLFCGTRGVGKTSIAKIFARAVNCESFNGSVACGKCAFCKGGSELNMDVFELDAASNNGVDEIRELKEKVKYPPVVGKYKVYIVDEVHMLSTSAFNAFLKTLEEPPAHAIFILATTEAHKLPATILSRCIRFDFRLVGENQLKEHIKKVLKKEKVSFDEEAISLIAESAEGSVRDALSIADMCVAFTNGNLTEGAVLTVLGAVSKRELLELSKAILASDIASVVNKTNSIFASGRNPIAVCKDLGGLLKNLIILKNIENYKLPYSSEFIKECSDLLNTTSERNLLKLLEQFCELEQQLKQSSNPLRLFETWCIKMAGSASEASIAPITQEKKTENGFNWGSVLTTLRTNGHANIIGAVSNADVVVVENNVTLTVETSAEKSILEKSAIRQFLPQGYMLEVALKEKKDYSGIANNLKEKLGDMLKIKED